MTWRIFWSMICWIIFILGVSFFFKSECWAAPSPVGLERPPIDQAEAHPEPVCEWMSETEMLRNADAVLSQVSPLGIERIAAQMKAEGKDFGPIDRVWLGVVLDTATVFLIVDDCLIAVASAPAVEVEAIMQGRDPPIR